jgi:peptide/nickel transport system ATP-binding protein
VDGVSLSVPRGRTLGVVGESGCGKSVLSLSVMRLVPPPGRVAAGRVLLDGRDLLALPLSEMRDVRGSQVAMVFQEPMTSLNPVHSVGAQIVEAMRAHDRTASDKAMRDAATAALRRVRIPSPERRFDEYPHQLSGGMRQRVMIAMALACRPRLLIADEPTTALDVTVQAQILALLDALKRETGTAVVLITHDLGVVADHADDVAVMYAGRVVERAPAAGLFARPEHPYTVGLLGAAPGSPSRQPGGGAGRLASIDGTVPDPRHPPPGCRFAPRCPFRIGRCTAEAPPLAPVPDAGPHETACWRAPLDRVLDAAAA